LAYGDKRYGILSVSVPAEYAEDLEEKELFDELADDLSFALYKIEAEERRKAAEETIIRQKAELEATLYGIGDGVIAADSEGCVARMNPTAERMTGWTEDEAKGLPLETIFQIINEKTGKPALNPVTQVLKKGVVVNLGNHTVLISKDGRKTPISDSGAPIYDARGEMTGVVLVFQDQTTERLQQKLLETRLSLIEYGLNHNMDGFLARALDEVGELADSPIGFYHFIDSDQKTLSLQQWSTRTKNDFCKADGKGLHHSINQAGVWVDCMHVKKPVIHNDYKKLPHKKGLPDGHADVVRELVVPVIRHGRIVSILGVGNKPCDYTKDDVGLVSYLADVIWEIVSKKQAEDALRDSERQKDLILNSANEMVAYYDKNLRIVWANRASGESVGKKPEDLIGMHCYEVWHQRNSPCENCPVIQARKEKVPKEAEQQTPDGRFWNIRGYPVLNDSGEVTALIEFGQDITDRKRAEELKKKELN
jgi:PAS domain S-box-containing protein